MDTPVRISIRRARPADAATLTRIAHAAKRHWGYPDAWIRRWRDALTVSPEAIRGDAVYCAARAGRVIGFYAVSGAGATREIEHMWITPRAIGRGVGAQLFAHMCTRLQAMGVTRLRIASDPNAEGFYRRMGARRIGRVASTPRGRDLPLLVLRLPRTS